MSRVGLALVGVLSAVGLVACGGGGGGGSPPSGSSSAPSYPSSGVYAPVLKTQGSTTSPTLALSLVHPSDPSVEYVIEDGSIPVSDTMTLYTGTVNAGAGRIDNVAPYALLYIADGVVRGLPLVANGSAPSSHARTSFATVVTACKFVPDPNANDYANPDATRVVVMSKGADGVCGTADDTTVPYRYDSASNTVPLIGAGGTGSFVRDAKTLAPAYQVEEDGVVTGGKYYVITEPSASGVRPKFRRVVGSTPGLALVDLGSADADSQLTALDVAARTYVTLGQAVTGGGGWQLIGHDATAFYAYRNGGTTVLSTWAVVKVTKAQPVATHIASGTGLVASAAMGQGLLYLTVQQPSANKLFTVDKASPYAMAQRESVPVTSLTTVLASAGPIHLFWRVNGLGTSPSYRIDMMDEDGALRASARDGVPMAMVQPATIDPSRGENRTRFIYASDVFGMSFSEASLISYDASTMGSSPVVIAKLPSSTLSFAGNPVFANAAAAPANFMGGRSCRPATAASCPAAPSCSPSRPTPRTAWSTRPPSADHKGKKGPRR